MFFSPIIVTILSVVVLKERLGPHRIGAVLAGFVGMLLILRPGVDAFDPELTFALGGSVCNAIYLLMTRQLAGREDASSTQFNTTAVGAVVLSLLMIPAWEHLDAGTVLILVVLGAAGAAGHFALVRAFAYAPASLLSPFLYSQVLAASLLSVVIFGDTPQPVMVLGTMILVGSGLCIWWRENRRVARG